MKLLIKCAIFFLIFFGLVESVGRFVWRVQKKEEFISQKAWEGNNTFAAEIGGTMAGYAATLSSHPYLTHVHKSGNGTNRQGLFGRDFPESRDAEFYQVLITGGSVACQLAGITHEAGALTEELEKNYLSKTGKPIRVYNGADGAWKLPQQTILMMMYSKRFDLVISIDGFNENYLVKGDPYYLEMPSPSYRTVSPLGFHAKTALATLWITAEINQIFSDFPILNRSLAAYWLGQGSLNLAKLYDEKTKPQKTPVSPFEYPPDQCGEDQRSRRKGEQMNQLRDYLALNQVICQQQGARYVSVLQPCPAIGKKLTEEEKRSVGSLSYKEDYLEMSYVYQSVSSRYKYPFLNLLEVFASINMSVYVDHIHCENGKSSYGYGILARAVGDFLAMKKILNRAPSGK